MRNRKVKQAIIKASKGIASHLGEFLLIELKIIDEILNAPPGSRTMNGLNYRISQRLDLSPDSKRTQNVVEQAKSKGLITNNLQLTKRGEKRLKQILPSYHKPPKWDGKWYIVIFDIPESWRAKRDILRRKLIQLGFAQLQKSVWISPYNYFLNVTKLIETYNLEKYIILSIAEKIGVEDSSDIAARLWNLTQINKEYQEFIEKHSSQSKSQFELKMDYLSVLNKDPQLPKDLLPSDWKGEQAFSLYQK